VRIEAKVRRVTDKAVKNRVSALVSGRIVPIADIPPASGVRIEPLGAPEKGFLLFYLDGSGNQIADGWHLTLDEAKRQAKLEFEIEEEDWFEVSPT
jgi:hypothetical protein